MSACNVILTPNTGYIATDSAVYMADREVMTYGPKTHLLPHLRCAFAGRGSTAFQAQAAAVLAYATNRTRCIDGLLPIVQEQLLAVREQMLPCMEEAGQTDAQTFLVGWSDNERRVIGFELSYFEENGDRFHPERLADTCYLTPGTDDVPSQYRPDYGVWPLRRLTREPDAFMVYAMKKQRQAAIDLGDTIPAWRGWIGGDIMFTEITKHGVRQRSILRWPDEIGLKAGRSATLAA